jgi:hypothetical protein
VRGAVSDGRPYRDHYVCRNAQRNGWAVCPSKSLPANAIEQSVVGKLREEQRELPGVKK